MPLPSMKIAKRCEAHTKSTGQQCQNPAAYSTPVCRLHGARKKSTVLTGTKHPNYQHGQGTNEAKAASQENAKLFKQIAKVLGFKRGFPLKRKLK